MSEETCCITNKGNATKDEWEDDDSGFPQAIPSVYKKIGTIVFLYVLFNFFMKSYISSVNSCKYIKKLVSY